MSERGRRLELCKEWGEGTDGSDFDSWLMDKVISTEAQVKALEADRARLDWLDVMPSFSAQRCRVSECAGDETVLDVSHLPSVYGKRLREAIDAAIQAASQTKEPG